MTSIKDIQLEIDGDVAIVRLNRPAKRNALSDALVIAVRDTFQNLPPACGPPCSTVPATISAPASTCPSSERDAGAGLHHSRMWHACLEEVQYGPVPVVAALHGAVVGGGLELAASCHIRVADATTFYALPEGSRGIFVGRRRRGAHPAADRRRAHGRHDAHRPRLPGRGRRARRLRAVPGARRPGRRQGAGAGPPVAQNAPLTNYALMHALPRIAEQPADQGFLTEALMAAIAQSARSQAARARLPGRPRRQGRQELSAAHEET